MATASTTIRTAVLALVLALSLSLLSGVDAATVDGTCKAAAGSDKRVNVQLCVSQLGQHLRNVSASADAWGLAKAASLAGVSNADLAAADIKAALHAKPPPPRAIVPALAQCGTLYGGVASAFASAHDAINKRAYAAGTQRLTEALTLTQQCNAGFARAGVTLPRPLDQRTANSVQIAIIAGAITRLIK